MRFWLLGLAFLFLPLSIIQDFRENLVVAKTISQEISGLEKELKKVKDDLEVAEAERPIDSKKIRGLETSRNNLIKKLEAAQKKLDQAKQAAQNTGRTGGQGQSSGLNTKYKGEKGDIAGAAKKQKIAKKNLKFIGTPIAEGSTEYIDINTKAIEESIKDKKQFLKINYYRKSDKPKLENAEEVQAEIDRIETGEKLLGINKKEYETCTEISNYKSNFIVAYFKNCSLEGAKKFEKLKLTALNTLKLAYTKKDQVIEKKSKAQKTEENLKQGIDPLVVAEREKYYEALAIKKNTEPFLSLSRLYSIPKGKKTSQQEMKNKFNTEEKIDKEIQELEAIICTNGETVCLEKTIALAKIVYLEEAKKLITGIKIIDKYQTAFNDADKKFKKLIERQSSQDLSNG